MATYTGQITVPNTETWAINGAYFYFRELSYGGGSVLGNSLAEYLDNLALIIPFTYALTVGESSTLIEYTFENFSDNGEGAPIMITITADSNAPYSASFNTSSTTTTTCPTCLSLTKSACQDSYTFVAGLTASTDYWVVIENNRNKRYIQQVTTDGSGDFVIDATAPEFPEGFFIPEQFTYTLKVYTTAELTTEAEITYNNTVYNCITLSFIYTVTTTASIGGGVDLWVDDSLNFVIDDTFNTISVG